MKRGQFKEGAKLITPWSNQILIQEGHQLLLAQTPGLCRPDYPCAEEVIGMKVLIHNR